MTNFICSSYSHDSIIIIIIIIVIITLQQLQSINQPTNQQSSLSNSVPKNPTATALFQTIRWNEQWLFKVRIIMIDDVRVCKLQVEETGRPLLCSTPWIICQENRASVPRPTMQLHDHLSLKHKKLGVVNRRLDSSLDHNKGPFPLGIARCKTLRHARVVRNTP